MMVSTLQRPTVVPRNPSAVLFNIETDTMTVLRLDHPS